MSLIEHAKRELAVMGYIPLEQPQEDGPNKWIQQNLLELLEVFSKQEHSGSSAGYCIEAFRKLASFQPLGPLTGESSEWMEVGNAVFQNKRCSHVFKQPDRFNGQAYDLNGKVFQDASGIRYTSYESLVPITFPYAPVTQIIDDQTGKVIG